MDCSQFRLYCMCWFTTSKLFVRIFNSSICWAMGSLSWMELVGWSGTLLGKSCASDYCWAAWLIFSNGKQEKGLLWSSSITRLRSKHHVWVLDRHVSLLLPVIEEVEVQSVSIIDLYGLSLSWWWRVWVTPWYAWAFFHSFLHGSHWWKHKNFVILNLSRNSESCNWEVLLPFPLVFHL